jgi:hypothetical protein
MVLAKSIRTLITVLNPTSGEGTSPRITLIMITSDSPTQRTQVVFALNVRFESGFSPAKLTGQSPRPKFPGQEVADWNSGPA